MVKNYFVVFCYLVFTFLLLGSVHVSVEIDEAKNSDGRPLVGMVKIIRESDVAVDEQSFSYEGKPLSVTLVQESKQSNVSIINGLRKEYNYLISLYKFEMDPKPKGKHVLKPITVSIGGKIYQTKRHIYEITSAEESSHFRLTALYEGPETLYPGHKIKLIYRITYNLSLEPTYQYFPLLEKDYFRKIGEKVVRTYNQGNSRVQEIIQEVEVEKPGIYSFEESVIEAFGFYEDFFGRRSYKEPKLKAIAPPLTIQVQDFPKENQPLSFNGAVGSYRFFVRLLNEHPVMVGDKLQLEIKIIGDQNISNIELPDFSKQSGFKGNFRMSDLPPVGKVMGPQKVFIYELRPMSSYIKEIPSMEFSFFDPETKKYETVSSPPIPIIVHKEDNIHSNKDNLVSQTAIEISSEMIEDTVTPSRSYQVNPISIATNFQLSEKDKASSRQTELWWLLSMPIGLSLLSAQVGLKRYLTKQKNRKITSKELMDHLMLGNYKDKHLESFVKKIIIMKLQEKGLLPSNAVSLHEVNRSSISQELYSELEDFESMLYSPNKKCNKDELITLTKRIYEQL